MRIRWRGLELPHRVQIDSTTATEQYGSFLVEPFERGFGATVGNCLRRILLSGLEGSSVTRVKISGVPHEFTVIPGVVEDVTDICLNFKTIVVRNYSATPKVLRISKNERGVVTAGDIVHDEQVKIFNRDAVLATMTDDVPFNAEVLVENGRGYIPVSEYNLSEFEVGTIPLDSLFSPVVRVRYRVDETRVGHRTNFDRLSIEIWTNGSISPEYAFVESAKIMRKHLSPIISYREPGPELSPDSGLRGMQEATGYSPLDLELEQKLSQSLAELNLSVRATNCLESEGINTVRDLVVKNEDQLLQVRNFGETTLQEVRDRLSVAGLRLGMRIPSHHVHAN